MPRRRNTPRFEQQPLTYEAKKDYEKTAKTLMTLFKNNSSSSKISDWLTSEKNTKVSLKQGWDKAKEFIGKGKVGGGKTGALARLSADTKIAITAFTLDEPNPNIYKEFNEQSRTLTDSNWKSFQYKSIWLMLNSAILEFGNRVSQTLFRGVRTLIEIKKGSVWCFGQIASTSKDKDMAVEFATFGSSKGTVFIINTTRYLEIKDLSEFEDEEEYIIPAMDKFRVTSVTEQSRYREICLQLA